MTANKAPMAANKDRGIDHKAWGIDRKGRRGDRKASGFGFKGSLCKGLQRKARTTSGGATGDEAEGGDAPKALTTTYPGRPVFRIKIAGIGSTIWFFVTFALFFMPDNASLKHSPLKAL
ncbi:MAG: hypothetical protein LBF62_14605 [Tannerellaceae bacterium]|jgi:hypothetical protein|nr:hypothetical protein [Tannerellaceae bacterium]